jgi:RNA polymerase sigma-70 factor (ECF subfamily)
MDEEFERTRGLLERARNGDEEAYEALFTRYRAELERRARTRLRPSERRLLDASDVVQECELAAVEGFESFEYRGPGSFRRWLHKILANQVAMEQRFLARAKRELGREVQLAVPDPERSAAQPALADSATSPSNRAAAEERRARLLRLLATLPEDHRRVVQLVKLEERSIAEAAARLGRTENAVKKLLARALLRLGDEVRGEGLGETR